MADKVFVWFFGPSGAGKRHTIEHLVADTNHPIRSRLHLLDPVVAVQCTLDGRNWPPVETIFDEIRGLAQSAGSYLIKAQHPNLTDEVPVRLSQEFPDARHEIVLVWADPNTLFRRCQERTYPLCTDATGHAAELRGQLEGVPRVGLPITPFHDDGAGAFEYP